MKLYDMSWWEKPETKEDSTLCARVFQTVEQIEKDQAAVHEANERHARLYQGYTPPGLGFHKPVLRRDYNKYLVTKNIVKSVCDTATSLVAKTRPKATFVTDGADWRVQRKAELLDMAMVGAFTKAKVHTKWQKAFRDATIFGTGVIKLIPDEVAGFVDVERVVVDEIVVDEKEFFTRDGDPWNIYHVRIMARAALKKMFPKHAAALDDPSKQKRVQWAEHKSLSDSSIVVIEAWHRAKGGGKGRHVIVTENVTLFDGNWEHDWFPFVFMHWCEPISGFYGQGLAELLCGRQMNINEIYRFIRRAQELIVVPRVFVDSANSLLKSHLTNEVGAVIPTRGGKPPTFYTPQALTQEIYRWLNGLEDGGYDEAGISTASASNRLPAGIESAPSQREYSYKEGQRFAPVSQRYEDAFIETATKMIHFYKTMNKKAGVKSTFINNNFMRQIEWKDVDLENDQYEIRVEASSIETLSPSARMQTVIELSQTGWIEEMEGRRLMGHPDLIASDRLNTASIRYAEWVAGQLSDGVAADELVPDGATEDILETYKHVRASYLMKKMSTKVGPLDSVLEEHVKWLMYAKEELAKAAPPPMPAGPPGIPSEPMMPEAPMMPQDANLLKQGM